MNTLLPHETLKPNHHHCQKTGGHAKLIHIQGYKAFNPTNTLIEKEPWRRQFVPNKPTSVQQTSYGSELLVEPPF